MSRNLIYISYRLDSRVSHYAGILLDCLLTYGDTKSDRQTNIYPSNPTLAKKLKTSVRTIIRAKNELESLGMIIRYYDDIEHMDKIDVPFTALDEYTVKDKSEEITVTDSHHSVDSETPENHESVAIPVTDSHTTLPNLYYFKGNNIYKEKNIMPIALKNKGPEFVDPEEQYEWLTTKISEMKKNGDIQGEASTHHVADLVVEISFHIEHRAEGISSKHAANAALKWLREGRWQVPMKLQVQRRQEAEERERKYSREKEAARVEEINAYRKTLGNKLPFKNHEEDRTEDLIKFIEHQNQHGITACIKSKFKYAEAILKQKGLYFYFKEETESIDIGQQDNYNGQHNNKVQEG